MIGETLDCPICYQEFNDNKNIPYVSRCGHSICGICMKQIHEKQLKKIVKKECPICRDQNIKWFINIQFLELINKKILYCGKCRYPLNQYFGMYYQLKKIQNSCKFCYYSKKKNNIKIKNYQLNFQKDEKTGKNYNLSNFEYTQKETGGSIVTPLVFFQQFKKICKDHEQFSKLMTILKDLQNVIDKFFQITVQIKNLFTKKYQDALRRLNKVQFHSAIRKSLQHYDNFRVDLTKKKHKNKMILEWTSENFKQIMYNNKCFELFVYNKLQRMSFSQNIFILSKIIKFCSNLKIENQLQSQIKQIHQDFKNLGNEMLKFTHSNQMNYIYYRNPFNLIELNQLANIY